MEGRWGSPWVAKYSVGCGEQSLVAHKVEVDDAVCVHVACLRIFASGTAQNGVVVERSDQAFSPPSLNRPGPLAVQGAPATHQGWPRISSERGVRREKFLNVIGSGLCPGRVLG